MIKNLLFIFFFSFAITQNLFSQPVLEWDAPLGGNSSELAYGIEQTSDGGLIVCGLTSSNNGDVSGLHSPFYADYWLVKLNASGELVWQKCLGGSFDDYAYSIEVTSNNGYIIAGSSDSNDDDVSENNGLKDYWIVKTDSLGNIEWERSYGGSQSDEAYSISSTSDGGYIVAGISYSDDGDVTGHHGSTFLGDYWIIKIDSTGNLIWQKSAGGGSDDIARKVIELNNHSFLVAGESYSDEGDITDHHGFAGIGDVCIMQLDAEGNLEWQRSYGGSFYDGAYDILQVHENKMMIAGYTSSDDGDVSSLIGDKDYWIISIDSTGNLLSEKTYGGSQEETATQITQTASGDYFITGYTFSDDGDVSGHHSNADYWPVKIDTAGNMIWQYAFGGNLLDFAYDGLQTASGAYIMAGASNSLNGDVSDNNGFNDVWVIQLESDCAIADAMFTTSADSNVISFTDASVNATSWFWDFGDGTTDTIQNPVHAYTASGDYQVCLTASDSCSSDSMCVTLSITIVIDQIQAINNRDYQVYPNPFNDHLTIETQHATKQYNLFVYNASGSIILNSAFTGNTDIATSYFPNGIYLLIIKDGNEINYMNTFTK